MPGGVLSCAGLTRRFAAVIALQGVDLKVEAGESVAILGPNGAGKTTLMRVIATLLRPSAGTLLLFDRPIGDGGAQARRRIGFLSHHSFLYPDLTPTENLEFYARMFHVPAVTQRVHELIERVGLTGWAHRPVRMLSRGLEQRCALARALLHRPDLLLLDEPFTGLDVDASATLIEMLRQEQQRGMTMLMTTHDLARGLDLCRRAVVLVRGKIRYDRAIDTDERATFEGQYRAAVQSGSAD